MIHLVDIDPGNWRTGLHVAKEQAHYVADPAVILARAYAYRAQQSRAFLICDEETPVGMGLYYEEPELDCYDFSQFFIDERHQGKGYGKAATKAILDAMRQEGKYPKVELCYIEGNETARKLYERFGFVQVDRDEDEIIMRLLL